MTLETSNISPMMLPFTSNCTTVSIYRNLHKYADLSSLARVVARLLVHHKYMNVQYQVQYYDDGAEYARVIEELRQ